MSDTQDNVRVKIVVTDDGSRVVEGFQKKVKNNAGKITNSWKGVNSTFSAWLKKASKIALTFVGITTLVTSLTGAVRTLTTDTIEFDRQQTQVRTLLDESSTNFANLQEKILSMGGALGDVTNITRGTYQMISSGQPAADALNQIGISAKFAQGGQVALKDAVSVGTVFLNSYGEAAGGLAHIYDVLWGTIERGVTTAPELAHAIGRVAPMAQQAGLSIEELNASIASMTQISQNTNETVTSLRGILNEVIKPSEEAAKEAERLGINFSLAGVKAMGFSAWLQDVMEKVRAGNGDLSKMWGRVDALNGIFQLTRNNMSNFNEELARMGDVQGNTEKNFKKWQESFQGAWETMKNRIQSILIKELLPVLKDVANWITQNADKIEAFVKSAIDAFKSIGRVILYFKDVLITAGEAYLTYFSVKKISTWLAASKGVFTAVGKIAKSTGSVIAESSSRAIKSYQLARTFGVGAFGAIETAAINASHTIQNATAATTSLGAKLAALPTHIKATVIIAAAYVGWKTGQYMDEELGISEWLQEMDDKFQNWQGFTVEGLKEMSQKANGFNQEANNLAASIRSIAHGLTGQNLSLRAAAQAIAGNASAYSSLTAEQQEFVTGMIGVINQAPTLEYHIQKLSKSLGVASTEMRVKVATIIGDYKAFSSLPADMQQKLTELAQKYQSFAKIGGGAIEFIRGRLFAFSKDAASASSGWLNSANQFFRGFQMYSGAQQDASTKAKALLADFEAQKKTILGSRSAIEMWIGKLTTLSQSVTPDVRKEISGIVALLQEKKKALGEAKKATEEFLKKVNDLAASMGILTDKGYSELLEKARAYQQILVSEAAQIFSSKQKTQQFYDIIKKLISTITDGGREVPAFVTNVLKQIEDRAKNAGIEITDLEKQILNFKGFPKSAGESIEMVFGLSDGSEKAAGAITILKAKFEELPRPLTIAQQKAGNLAKANESVKTSADKLGNALGKTKVTVEDITQALAAMVNISNQAIDALVGMGVVSEETGSKLKGITSGVGGIAAGMNAWEKAGTGFAGILSKVSAGFTVATAAITTFAAVLKLISGKSGELKAAERALKGLTGTAKDYSKEIEELAKKIGGRGSAEKAFYQLFPNMIKEASIGLNNIGDWTEKLRNAISLMTQGITTPQETIKNFGAAFDPLLEKFRELGLEGGAHITGLFLLLEEKGLKVPQVTKYLEEQKAAGADAYQSLKERISDVNIQTLTQSIEDQRAKLSELEVGTREYAETQKELAGLETQWTQLEGVISVFGDAIIPVYDEILQFRQNVADNQVIVDSIKEWETSFLSLSNTTRLTEQEFDLFENKVQSSFDLLITQGFSSEQALQVIAPQLERLILLNKDYGLTLDEGTQKLIEEARAANLVAEEQQSANSIMEAGFGRVVDALHLVAKGLGVEIPEAANTMAERVRGAAGNMRTSMSQVTTGVGVTVDQVQRLGDEIVRTDQRWVNAVTGNTMTTAIQELNTDVLDTTQSTTNLGNVIQDVDGRWTDSLDHIQDQTHEWKGSLGDVNDMISSTLTSSVSDLDRHYTDHMTGHSIVTETKKWLDMLKKVDEEGLYKLIDTFTLLDMEFGRVVMKMGDQAQTFLLGLDGKIRDLAGAIGYLGQQTYSDVGSNYGVYTDEEKVEMTAKWKQMTHLWQADKNTILQDQSSMERFYRDLQGLVVTDDFQDEYERFKLNISQWLAHLQRGETWNGSSWEKPEVAPGYEGIGLYSQEQLEAMTDVYKGYRNQWNSHKDTILLNQGNVQSIISKLNGLTVVDTQKNSYNSLLSELGTALQKLKDGFSWNNGSWTPPVSAASGASFIVPSGYEYDPSRPYSGFPISAHAGELVKIFTREETREILRIQQQATSPMTLHDYFIPEYPEPEDEQDTPALLAPIIIPAANGGQGGQSKETKIEINIGDINIDMPIHIQSNGEDDELANKVAEMAEDNFRGLGERIATIIADQVKEKINAN